MINPISTLSPASQVTDSVKVSPKTPITKAPVHPTGGGADGITLSSTAKAYAAALQESRETPTQTAQEAQKGDLQARRLLAREAYAKPASK
jgi:hypothetical protein